MKRTIEEKKLAKMIVELRQLDFYSELRSQGYMTSGQVCEACDIVENKIDALLKEYGL